MGIFIIGRKSLFAKKNKKMIKVYCNACICMIVYRQDKKEKKEMKIEDAKKLKKGDQIMVSIGNGWYETYDFVRLVEVRSLGKVSLSSLMNNTCNLNMDAKPHLEIVAKDGEGKSHTITIRKAKKKG